MTNGPTTAALQKVVACLKENYKMTMTFGSNEALAEYLRQHPEQTSLALYDCPADVTILPPTDQLIELSLKRCAGFTSLSGFSKLTKLVLDDCPGFPELELPETLTVISVSNCPNITLSRLPKSLIRVWVVNCPKITQLLLPVDDYFSVEFHSVK